MRPRDETKIESIFKATIELTGAVGISGLKMSNIAKKAGLASGTVYLYFKNKEKLLNEVYKYLKSDASKATLVDVTGMEIKDQLRVLWDRTIRYRAAHHAELIFMEQFVVSPYVTKESKKVSETYLQFISGILEEGRRKKELKNTDASILLPFLSGYARDLTTAMVSRNQAPTDDIIEQSFEICWDAISLKQENKNN
ncbi:TetR/AcrR family transcriptional regulator [Maribacter sp.]|nr:TetR/AcrR family transcriptional regulator [Maribacter sp.]